MEQNRRYVKLHKHASTNEQIWSGFRRIEINMIGAQSLGEMIGLLIDSIPLTFPLVEVATLCCVDPEYEMSRLLAEDGGALMDKGAFFTITQEELEVLFPQPRRPKLGPVDVNTRSLLFPLYREPLGSMALTPLLLHGKLIGCLNQGSANVRHFNEEIATHLLEHLAAVTAMCIENALIHEKLKLDGLTDALTHVANRRFFERRLAEEVERWMRRSEPLSCLVADIDHFKRINDSHGHLVGDQVLKQMAAILGQDLRACDVLARYGGEEFVFLLPNASRPQAVEIAERLRVTVESMVRVTQGGQTEGVTISIGVACLEPNASMTAIKPGDWLFKQADQALYRAKQAGRNRVEPAETSMTVAESPSD
jgi:diguanylate cyclase (GGDEF)-like protein